jgi:hypothetical protein
MELRFREVYSALPNSNLVCGDIGPRGPERPYQFLCNAQEAGRICTFRGSHNFTKYIDIVVRFLSVARNLSSRMKNSACGLLYGFTSETAESGTYPIPLPLSPTSSQS